ncbi:MAG TPA: GNAT family N-acetyltransferase [Perlabentimonas sp.]|nr:GNAT family N-acetyltransferase [Perlabentimonas sp.]
MRVVTTRLEIKPLNLEEFKAIIESRAKFERMAQCNISGFSLPDSYCAEVTEMLEKRQGLWSEKSNDYLFYTLWTMIDTDIKSIVGLFTFNGKPNAQGEVEVYFSIESPYRRKGYGYEAMRGMLKWASGSELFKRVLVEADFDNKAAMASLKKLGFKPIPVYDYEGTTGTSTKYYISTAKPKDIDSEELDFD